MRILVADNDARVRSALHMLLKQEPGEAVIAESGDLDSMAVQIREFQPELVLLDWELPGHAAAALLIALGGLELRPKIIVLSGRSDARKMALALGADDFVYKGDPPDQLLLAYRQNAAGRGGTVEPARPKGWS
jgi:DNA-binding NarL/FixJ family response regulator